LKPGIVNAFNGRFWIFASGMQKARPYAM